MKTVVVFCVAFFFPRFKTQTRDANAPVETETRDAQRSRKHHVPRKEIFFFCFFVFFGLVVFLPPNKKCVCCFLCVFCFLRRHERRVFFFSLVVDVCVVGLPHTKVFVSFRFFSDEKDDDQKKRDTKREYEMIRVW